MVEDREWEIDKFMSKFKAAYPDREPPSREDVGRYIDDQQQQGRHITYPMADPVWNQLEWQHSRMISRAVMLAAKFHSGQTDKCGQPYILHPLRVMMNPSLTAIKERIVAVLHDTIEDTDCQLTELNEFGEDIVEAVKAITHIKNEPQTDYLHRVKANPLALAVKLADIEDNLSPARMNALSETDRERLTEKYSKALALLKSDAE